tara:strand:- start:71 stop:550 length:480 start_codon:yes stop_codon:yes gene_type:complete
MKQIKGYGRYRLVMSDSIYDTKKDRFLTKTTNKRGYVYLQLTDDNGKRKGVSFHRLVASVHLGLDLSDSSSIVDHIDGNTSNNSLDNLRVCSNVENTNWGKGNLHNLPYYITKNQTPSCKQGFSYVYGRTINGKHKRLKSSISLDKVIEFKKEYENKYN